MSAASPPGRLIDIGTHRLHLRCEGEGSPTVVFDAALGGSTLSWTLVQPAVARVTQTCTYDRGGFGWSEAGPMPRTAGRIADELHALLERSAVPPPYVLVGHSFGALVMRLFTARHPQSVAGLVLIEPAIPEQWIEPDAYDRARLARGVRLCRYGATASQFGVAKVVSWLVALGALQLARVIARGISRGGLRRDDEEILAPIYRLPASARRVLRTMWTQRKFFDALRSQMEHMCASADEVLQAPIDPLRELPLTVITAARAGGRRLAADAALAQVSRHGRHVLVADSGHWVPLDAPEAVSDAIIDLVRGIRTR